MTAAQTSLKEGQTSLRFGQTSISTRAPGGGVVKTLSVLRDSRIMRDNLRMADNG